MKQWIKQQVATPKDIIALIIITAYAIAFLTTTLIPGVKFDELMGRQYERIMLMVVGFYFGSHRDKGTVCPYLEDISKRS